MRRAIMAILEHAGRVFQIPDRARMGNAERLAEICHLADMALMHMEIGRPADAIPVLETIKTLTCARCREDKE